MTPLRLAVLLVLIAGSPSWSWELRRPGDGRSGNGASLGVRADGDLILAHCIRGKDADARKVVARFSPATGARLWQTTLERVGYCAAPHLVVTPVGDAIVSHPLARLSGEDGSVVWDNGGDGLSALALRGDGTLIASDPDSFGVSAFDVDTGGVLWTNVLDLRPGDIATTATGDVVVTAYAPDDQPEVFGVVALDGASGAERWRYTTAGTADWIDWNAAFDVAVDEAGDVVAAGFLANEIAPLPNRDYDQQPLVVKLDGATGAERWARLMPPPVGQDATADDVTITPDGDVITSISGYAADAIVKLSGASGADVWRAAWMSNPEAANGDYVQDLRLSGAGDVIASGSSSDWAAVGGFSGASGTPLWFRALARPADPLEDQVFPDALVLDANDDPVLVASVLRRRDTYKLRIHVIGFAEAVAGQRLVIRDDGTRRALRVVLRDPRIQPALDGGPGDPALEGASLHLASTGAGGSVSFSLAGTGWAPLPAPGGFRYEGSEADGCRAVTIKPGVLRARCTSTEAGLTLTQPLGTVSVRLTAGDGAGFAQCAEFGGTVVVDRSVTGDIAGRFEAIDAPAPPTCG